MQGFIVKKRLPVTVLPLMNMTAAALQTVARVSMARFQLCAGDSLVYRLAFAGGSGGAVVPIVMWSDMITYETPAMARTRVHCWCDFPVLLIPYSAPTGHHPTRFE